MPTISMFYGIIISMYYNDHNPPHIHANYQGQKAVFSLDGSLLEGVFPKKQTKLVAAWMVIHQDAIIANWELAQNKQSLYKIDPLK